ncbi:hypothetical protein, partial [Salibaculum halophilum]|uniref:hypothetical protein n=1 Tax=Salibaculum halophilum TaxID=1914408 RepID=UPI0015C4C54E
HEATDDRLLELRGILVAAQLLTEEKRAHVTGTPEADALLVMHNLALAKLAEIDRTRTAEWVSLGGITETMTAEEIAAARGEK